MSTPSANTDPSVKSRKASTERKVTKENRLAWKSCPFCQAIEKRHPGAGTICHHHLSEWLGSECRCTGCGGDYAMSLETPEEDA